MSKQHKQPLTRVGRLAAILAAALLSSCADRAVETPWIKPETHTISCEEYFADPTPQGVLYNNVWNKKAAKGFAWKQCLEKSIDGHLFGWSWQWPTKSHSIYAYPQIKKGISPWDPAVSSGSEFPLLNTAVSRLVIAHDLEIVGNAEHNVATSLWLINSNNIGSQANPAIIIAELMIWTFSTENHMRPAGSHKADIEVEGAQWELWVDKNWGDASGENTNKWVYLTFKAKTSSLAAEFDVIKLLDYAIKDNILPAEFYLADIELGTEIMSGSGLAWVKSFGLTIE